MDLSVYDADGDPLNISYQWYQDGDSIMDWDENFVPPFLTEKHEEWAVIVTIDDGMGGVTIVNDMVTIQNTPPIVGVFEDTIVVYDIPYYTSINAFDPDVDRVVWHFIDPPEPPLVLDSLTGDLSWTDFTDWDSSGVYPVSIVITDGEEDVVVMFNLHLYPINHELFAPSNLDALSGYALSIPMDWDAPAFFDTEIGLTLTFLNYEIQRSEDLTAWTTIGNASGTGYVDAPVASGVMYNYRVRANYNEGQSEWSNVDFATAGSINSNSIYSAYTYAPIPEIDGELGADEWSDAAILEFGSVALYVKNTENMLYIAAENLIDDEFDADDALYIEIEDNHNIRWPAMSGSSEGEYRVQAIDDSTSETTYQGIWGTYPGSIGRDMRMPFEGLLGAVGGGFGAPVVFEIAIEINPDMEIVQAVNSAIGNVVGFRFAIYDAGDLEWDYTWLSGSPATDPESFGNLMLGVGVGGPKFRVWPDMFEVTLLEGEIGERPIWLSNQGNGSLEYHIYESYLPLWGRDPDSPILLYTDTQTIGVDALEFLGYGYDLATTLTEFMDFMSAEDYEAIVVTRMDAVSPAALAALENYLIGGGKVIINCPDLDGSSSHSLWATMGMNIMGDLGGIPSALTWELPGHPIFNIPFEVPPSVETVTGTFTDYGDGILSSGGVVLGTFDELPYPGNGSVVLSRDGMGIVNSFVMSDSRDDDGDGFADGTELLINELYYLAALTDIPWLSVAPDSGGLASHVTDEGTVTFDASALTEGDYTGFLMATSNDPRNPLEVLPCHLHVRTPAYHLVHLALPSELRLVRPGENFEMPIVADGLHDAGVSEVTMTVRTNGSVVSPMNVMSDYDITVLDYDIDHITFRLSHFWIMDDGHLCDLEFEVGELVPVGSFSNLTIQSVSYDTSAFVAGTDIINGRVMVEAGETDWRVMLEFTHGAFEDFITIGANPEGTDMFDDGLDLDNVPPGGWLDPFSDISDYDPAHPELGTDIRDAYDDVIIWSIPVGDSSGKLEWSFRDEDTLTVMGSLYLNGNIDMKTTSVYFYEANETLLIVYRLSGETPFMVDLYPGWNMISLPIVPTGIDPTPSNVYPDAMYAYYYDPMVGAWVEAEEIEPGVGYVVLSTGEYHYRMWGTAVSSYSLNLIRGWNLIGSLIENVDFSSPTTSPAGAIMGSPEHAWWFDVTTAGYLGSNVLEPGKGYFVASNLDATLYVPGVGGGKWNPPGIEYDASLEVKSGDRVINLGLGKSANNWLVPIPPPVDGGVPPAYLAFDGWRAERVYLADESCWELVVDGRSTVELIGIPDGESGYIVIDGESIALDGAVAIPEAGTYKIVFGELPRSFALHANVPNPFNAVTKIGFDLPNKEDVRLDIYDVLGNRVNTLIERELPAGSHSLVWDGRDDSGRDMPTGIYFYRLNAGANKSTRNMLLLK